ncbi:gamma-glutamylcyclotransferase family protein [Thalassorhabdus alkalitolerans]|uniref:Gamma-glutamylcyclotransferase family protein n=1 Tax=Thalassorhabdus alkalitolerans TaxID=2282697 RepID=A0ABW0YPG3_9BACI
MPYYFAYGSCMNVNDIKRTVDGKRLGPALLHDYTFGFRAFSHKREGGVADIIFEEGKTVEGALFEVPGFEELDIREGYPLVYDRIPVHVKRLESNEWVKAETYTIKDKAVTDIPPSKYYAGLIEEGAEILSLEYQDQLRKMIRELWRKGK